MELPSGVAVLQMLRTNIYLPNSETAGGGSPRERTIQTSNSVA
jgi:hypothetical protein